MTTEQRIEKIDAFLNTQKYLYGLQYRVIESENDGFIIEFQKASKRQLITLNRALLVNMMDHIRARAVNVLENDPPKKKKK